MESWEMMLDKALKENNETWSDIVQNTMNSDEMEKEFDPGFGLPEGIPFTVWTEKSVYFPICYDGAEWVGRVSRNPDGKPTDHQGGW